MDRAPYFRRKRNRKTSHLQWDDGTLGCYAAALYHEWWRGARIGDKVRAFFYVHLDTLPKSSTLCQGDGIGGWSFCPNAIADEVEKLILESQAARPWQTYADEKWAEEDALFQSRRRRPSSTDT